MRGIVGIPVTPRAAHFTPPQLLGARGRRVRKRVSGVIATACTGLAWTSRHGGADAADR